jgi:hypothetical protein
MGFAVFVIEVAPGQTGYIARVFEESGDSIPEVIIDATLLTVPHEFTAPYHVKLPVFPETVPRFQITSGEVETADGLDDTNVIPGGTLSDTIVLADVLGA